MSVLTPGSSGLISELSKRPYGLSTHSALLSSIKSCTGFVSRLKLGSRLAVHDGCVNTICWSDDGSLLLSGSDDRCLKLTSPYTGKVLCTCKTGHQANIFSAKFMPGTNFSRVISCAGDGSVQYSDLNDSEAFSSHLFRCPAGTTYDIEPFDSGAVINNNNSSAGEGGCGADSRCFISCGEDGCVRLYDLRERSSCSTRRCTHNVLFSSPRALTAMAMSPLCPWHVCVACAGGDIQIYDVRRASPTDQGVMLRKWQWCGDTGAPARHQLELDSSVRATSLRYDRSGRHLLASFSGRHVLLYDLTQPARDGDIPLVGPAGRPEPCRRPRRGQVSRIRVRGDWSDTGPRARPDSATGAQSPAADTETPERSPSSSLVRRIESALGQLFPDLISSELNLDEEEGGSGGGEEAERPQEVSERSRDRPVTRRIMRRIRRRRQLAALGLSSDTGHVSSDSSSPSRSSSPLQPQSRPLQRSDFLKHDGRPCSHAATASETSAPQPGVASATSAPQPGIASATSASNAGIGPAASASRADSAADIFVVPSVVAPDEGLETADFDTSQDRDIVSSGEITSDECDDSDVDDPVTSDCLSTADSHCDQPRIVASFSGHRNLRTMIKEAEFWGDEFIVSGSDCGHAFIWHRSTARLANILEADTHVVNRVRPHPFEPLLATSGIDYDIKLWMPIAEQSTLNNELASSLVSMNERMSEQNRDLVTVPAMFMLRMLHAFNRSRTPSDS